MQQHSINTVKSLSAPVKSALEQLLGRPLEDNEAVSIRAFHPHEAPSAGRKVQIVQALKTHLAALDQKAPPIPAIEEDALLDEAIRSVRPSYRTAL